MFYTLFLQHNFDLIVYRHNFSLAFIVLLLCGFIFYAVWFSHAIYSIYLFSFFLLFLIVIIADCMASCRHSDHIDDTNARNHQKSSNGGHTRRETRLAIENTRCQRIGQGMVHGKLSHHFWLHFVYTWFGTDKERKKITHEKRGIPIQYCDKIIGIHNVLTPFN